MIGEGAEANRMDGWDGDRGGKKKDGSGMVIGEERRRMEVVEAMLTQGG